ncbi:MAG TPA: hypothetical protein PLR84_13075, partial [Chitinophagales bacterium]|nr:hypothetical protein [Chitinophagales bacterium]
MKSIKKELVMMSQGLCVTVIFLLRSNDICGCVKGLLLQMFLVEILFFRTFLIISFMLHILNQI